MAARTRAPRSARRIRSDGDWAPASTNSRASIASTAGDLTLTWFKQTLTPIR